MHVKLPSCLQHCNTKTIEKMTVDRMKKRHGNINNEILMEKRVSKYTHSHASNAFRRITTPVLA